MSLYSCSYANNNILDRSTKTLFKKFKKYIPLDTHLFIHAS